MLTCPSGILRLEMKEDSFLSALREWLVVVLPLDLITLVLGGEEFLSSQSESSWQKGWLRLRGRGGLGLMSMLIVDGVCS